MVGSARCRSISTAIYAALAASDLFVAIGTSGSVYPAAGFVAQARARRHPHLRDQPRALRQRPVFDEARYGPAGEAVPAWVDAVLAAPG